VTGDQNREARLYGRQDDREAIREAISEADRQRGRQKCRGRGTEKVAGI
jgi:hypothetical protein